MAAQFAEQIASKGFALAPDRRGRVDPGKIAATCSAHRPTSS